MVHFPELIGGKLPSEVRFLGFFCFQVNLFVYMYFIDCDLCADHQVYQEERRVEKTASEAVAAQTGDERNRSCNLIVFYVPKLSWLSAYVSSVLNRNCPFWPSKTEGTDPGT